MAASSWSFEPGHTGAEFKARHMMVTWVRGHFKDIHGRVEFDPDDLLCTRFEGVIDVTKLWTGEPDRDDHLRSADFFDVENHPEITFVSRSIDVGEDGALRLEGDFTIKGITKPVTAGGRFTHFEQDAFGNPRAGFTLDATIDRTEFDLNWNAPLPGGGFALANDVRLVVDLQLTPEA